MDCITNDVINLDRSSSSREYYLFKERVVRLFYIYENEAEVYSVWRCQCIFSKTDTSSVGQASEVIIHLLSTHQTSSLKEKSTWCTFSHLVITLYIHIIKQVSAENATWTWMTSETRCHRIVSILLKSLFRLTAADNFLKINLCTDDNEIKHTTLWIHTMNSHILLTKVILHLWICDHRSLSCNHLINETIWQNLISKPKDKFHWPMIFIWHCLGSPI